MSDVAVFIFVRDALIEINQKANLNRTFIFSAVVWLFQLAGWGLSQDHQSGNGLSDSLRNVHREFDQHTEKRTHLLLERDRIQGILKETEREMQSIRDESVQKRMQLMYLRWEEDSYIDALNNPVKVDKSSTTTEKGIASLQSRANRANRALTQLDQDGVSVDLSHLESAAQVLVKRRMKVFQDGSKWKQEVSRWLEERPKFFDRYWMFTDPGRCLSFQECEALLSVFRTHADDNYPAIIAQALLEERIGLTEQALKNVERVLNEKTPLHAIALAVRGVIRNATKDVKKADSDFVEAYKTHRENPYFRFLRARHNANREAWKSAEDEAAALSRSPQVELDARRLLVAIYSIRAQKIPKYAKKAEEQARLVQGFTGDSDWYSNLLMAMAHAVAGATDEAITAAEKSLVDASDDQKPLVESILASIQANEDFDWDFLRR